MALKALMFNQLIEIIKFVLSWQSWNTGIQWFIDQWNQRPHSRPNPVQFPST